MARKFPLNLSPVGGFRAQVHDGSTGTSPHRQVPIEDSSFRFGNTKFTLTDVGKAQIKNVVTDPATGATYLDTAVASSTPDGQALRSVLSGREGLDFRSSAWK